MRVLKFATAMSLVIAIGLCVVASACNVPVFRFALERWRPDAYRIVLLHRGKLSEAELELLRPLQEQQDKALANVMLETVDLAADDASAKDREGAIALMEALGNPSLPSLIVQYPEHLRIRKPAWTGPLSREGMATAIESPIRHELARRLADGQTAVWLLLESGQQAKDDAATELIEEQLKELSQTLKLPELTTSPEDALATTVPLKLEFSVLRVPRNISAESALVAMLIGSESDLADFAEPMVFPVFGRGRALPALIGAGITANNIHEAASFLAGPCSCQVKEQNPGFDLLLAADWEDLLSTTGISLSAIETRSAQPTAVAELVPIPSGSSSPPAPPLAVATPAQVISTASPKIPIPNWAIVAGAGLVGLLVVVGLIAVAQSGRSHTPTD